MEIFVKKQSPENFTACIRVLSIFGVNTISHLNDFLTKPIWCEMYCDVIGQRHYMRNNQMVWNLFILLPCIIDMWTIVSVFFISLSTSDDLIYDCLSIVSFKNAEYGKLFALYKLSKMYHTLHINSQSL